MRAVNLLPRDTGRSKRGAPDLPVLVGAVVGVLVVALLAGGYVMESSKVASARRGLNAAKTQLAATPMPPVTSSNAVPTPAVVTNEAQPRLQAVASALSQRIAWDRILREFSLVLPSDVQLDSLTLTTPSPAALLAPSPTPAAPTGLQLSGVTYSYDSVARLLARMALVPDLTGVTLSNSSALTDRVVQFTISAAVKGAPLPVVTPVAPTTTTTTAGSSS
jgi:Tfp pilus assembly protein PilN